MGFDDLSPTGLVLGLGLSEASPKPAPDNHNLIKKPAPCSSSLDFDPCLTLGFSGESAYRKIDDHHLYRQASPHSSAVSSFSGGGGGRRVKRERDLSSEEVDLERVSSRISDEDEDGSNTRKKLRLSREQSALLEESFKQNSTLNPVTLSLSSLANSNLLFIWF